MATTVLLTVTIEPMTCGECGVPFGITADFIRERRRDHKTWYCPNGHHRWYPGKAPEEELAETKARLLDVRAERDRLADDNLTLARKNKTLRSRAKNGVCAFCKRSFKNVKAHMDTQHKKS